MRLFFVIVFFIIGSASFGQVWDLGVKGGFNSASAKVKNTSTDLSSMVGFHIGGYANTHVTDQFSIQPEALFSLQGWESSSNGNRNIYYFAIPIALKYHFVDEFNIHTGPQLAFLTGATDDIKDNLTGTDLSIILGAEYRITKYLGAAIRYNWGLINVIDNLETSSVSIYSRVLQVSATYQLTR